MAESYNFVCKAPHRLHLACDAGEFRASFERATRIGLAELARRYVSPGADFSLFLAGSIPLGLATDQSDIDFILIVDSAADLLDAAQPTGRNTTTRAVFRGSADGLYLGTSMEICNGIETDFCFVSGSAVSRTMDKLRSPGPELTEREIMILSRIRTGWEVYSSKPVSAVSDYLRSPLSFDVYCSTRFYTLALKFFEKACKAASLRRVESALYHVRLAAEHACFAFFASRGYAYLGSKWMDFIGTFIERAEGTADESLEPLFADGMCLVFPPYPASTAEAATLVDRAREFLLRMRRAIEQDARFKVAFAGCAQIYDVNAFRVREG